MADVRRAVRDGLALALPEARGRAHENPDGGASGEAVILHDSPLVLVALSGGPDSLALALALGFEQEKCGVRAGAVIVNHGLQRASAEVAERAAEQARACGLDPVVVRRVAVTDEGGGPEADARAARYSAFGDVARETGATAVLIGHTLDDQAETVLLGLARGSGARSLAGMRVISRTDRGSPSQDLTFVRPLLGLRREVVAQSLADQAITPWLDPQNTDETFRRVRVRKTVLPVLEAELGPGMAEALARTAAHLTADADYLDARATDALHTALTPEGALDTRVLVSLDSVIRLRCVRMWLISQLGQPQLSSAHVAAVDELIMNWHGQDALNLPGGSVSRRDSALETRCSPAPPEGIAV
jgi:tRNA(Ile)-lysidine synthase